jgi:hypothetical protein
VAVALAAALAVGLAVVAYVVHVESTPPPLEGGDHFFEERQAKLCDGAIDCETIYWWPNKHELRGTPVQLLACENEGIEALGEPQGGLFRAWLPVPGGARGVAVLETWLLEGELLPLHDAVVQLRGCRTGEPSGRPLPIAHFDVDPKALAWAAPGHDHLVIPRRGELRLDGDLVVKANVPLGMDARTQVATITLLREGDPNEQVFPDVGPGDSFPLADRRATVVRIVSVEQPVRSAWVEIALSAAPVTAATRDARAW